jgi:hypothetical protein
VKTVLGVHMSGLANAFIVVFAVVLALGIPKAAGEKSGSIAAAMVGSDRRVHILYGDGTEYIVLKEKGQVDCASAKVAEDKRTVGWLVESRNCCTSYPIPLGLVIYRRGRVVRRFEPGQGIWDWQFVHDGSQVAFWIGPTHGAFTPHFELHDVESGRLLAKWDGHVRDKHPAWVSGLKE